jgi:hypothetical protein
MSALFVRKASDADAQFQIHGVRRSLITLSRVGSFRAGRHGDLMRKFFTLLRKQKPLPGLGPTGALEAGGWQEASGCTRCRAKDPRQNSSINWGFLQARCLGNYLTFLTAGIFSISVSASSFGGSLTLMGWGMASRDL